MPRLWMRHETRPTERRAPIVPADARALVEAGAQLTVEESPQRAFAADDYAAAGCAIAPAGSWAGAPLDAVVVGIKELPAEPRELAHRHVFFGHAYKGQIGADDLLARFAAGGGRLLDTEYLVDDGGRRLAAFGYWAGYVGAALALLHHRGALTTPLAPTDRATLDRALAGGDPDVPALAGGDPDVTALVIGSFGRSGRGAVAALAAAGLPATRWDRSETTNLDTAALLAHDIMVNTVLTTQRVPPFLTRADVATAGRRLSVVSDVTADVTSDLNVLPIYDRVTTWDEPAVRVHDVPPLDVIAIDNLPSLLPVEASVAFSAELTPVLARVDDAGAPEWLRVAALFDRATTAVVG